jgi:outer membrane protein OmpA-like peptidoglycan-associated protein
MKNNFLIIFTFLIFYKENTAQSFKHLYFESLYFLEVYDFDNALPLLEKLYEIDPENSNTCFSIGNCLMSIKGRESEAIPYYEKASEHLTISYKIANYKEDNSPLEVFELLADAYHMNYEFDKAIEKYVLYKNFLSDSNLDDITSINRKIRKSKYAKSMVKNTMDLKIASISSINTEFSEYRPLINAEENEMYFTTKRPKDLLESKDDQGGFYEDIYYSYKLNNSWSKSKLCSSSLNKEHSSSALYFSPDGEFILTSMINNNIKLGPLGRSIYESERKGSDWNEPNLLQNNVNSKFWETTANMNLHKNILFFVSDRDGGYGGRDIWMIKKMSNGSWSSPENLGEPINTEYDEESPYIHPDGKTLYFSSIGHKTIGGFDIFKSILDNDLNWSSPVNMGYPINTVDDDLFFTPSVDGKTAYFSSIRKQGKGNYDIYKISLPLNDETNLSIYKGILKNERGEILKNYNITVSNNNISSNYQPNDSTGKFTLVLNPGESYNIKFEIDSNFINDTINVSSENSGFYFYSKSIDFSTNELVFLEELENITKESEMSDEVLIDNNETTIKPVVIKEETAIVDTNTEIHIIFYKNINFKTESSELSNKEKLKLDKLILDLKNNLSWTINSIGYTDNTGSIKYNQILSVLRSESVKTYICNRGVNYKRIKTIGMGEDHPIAENLAADGSDNPTGKGANRRVEIQILK